MNYNDFVLVISQMPIGVLLTLFDIHGYIARINLMWKPTFSLTI